ncbi:MULTISPECIES: DUF3035 domain-containing protein [Shimia]|uniref:DUF3035 domain-containing protein n=1 Tax=Shimia TaxID=573139 RepID=UPI001FB4A531|nr:MULTISPECIES: DUF3035 domain-containing protein [Shimia]MDV4144886.1 DUF3035 domain-containing protein [Shimia sp. FJ5]
MRIMRVAMIGCVLALAACSSDDGVRVLSSNGDGPDEFRILPAKPLSEPKSYTSLPEPTPGGKNLTDVDPKGDAVAALGGRRNAVHSDTIARSDSALVNYTGRNGRTEDIRGTLASEDEEFRKRRGRFANIKIVKQDRYNDVYDRYQLDQYQEQYRWRRGGATTPAAPPRQ